MNAHEIERKLLAAGYMRAKIIDNKWAAIRGVLNGYAIARGTTSHVDSEIFFYYHFPTCVDALEKWDGGRPENFKATFALKGAALRKWDEKLTP